MGRLWTLLFAPFVMSIACGGRANLEPSSYNEGTGTEDETDDGSLIPSGGSPLVVPGSGGSPGSGGMEPYSGGAPGIGGTPQGCEPTHLEPCSPGECQHLSEHVSLSIALEHACEWGRSNVPEYWAETGCGYVAVWWVGDVGDYGVDYYEADGGRGQLVGSTQDYEGGCPHAQGGRPTCNGWTEIDPCDGIDLKAYCETARAPAQAYFDELVEPGRACLEDSDCTLVSFGMECGYICPLSMNKFEIAAVGNAFYALDDDGRCRACAGLIGSSCATPPMESRCIGGWCELDGEYPLAGQFSPL